VNSGRRWLLRRFKAMVQPRPVAQPLN